MMAKRFIILIISLTLINLANTYFFGRFKGRRRDFDGEWMKEVWRYPKNAKGFLNDNLAYYGGRVSSNCNLKVQCYLLVIFVPIISKISKREQKSLMKLCFTYFAHFWIELLLVHNKGPMFLTVCINNWKNFKYSWGMEGFHFMERIALKLRTYCGLEPKGILEKYWSNNWKVSSSSFSKKIKI